MNRQVVQCLSSQAQKDNMRKTNTTSTTWRWYTILCTIRMQRVINGRYSIPHIMKTINAANKKKNKMQPTRKQITVAKLFCRLLLLENTVDCLILRFGSLNIVNYGWESNARIFSL